MKGNKFLAAVLAASMAFSTVPVTALNVFASTSVTSATADADATDFPTMTVVEGYLNTLTAGVDDSASGLFASSLNATFVEGTLNSQLTASGFSTIMATAVTETSDKLITSDADRFAYRTFDITLTNSNDNSTRKYMAVLTAEKLTDTEAKSILPTYMKAYITAHTAMGDTNAELKTNAEDAAKAFTDKYGVAVTVNTAAFDDDNSGSYTITFTVQTSTPGVTVTDTVKYKDSQVTVANKINGTGAGRKALKNAVLAMNYKPAANAAGVYDTADIAKTVTNVLTGFKAQNVSVTDAKNWSFEAYDSTGTYTVTIGTGADLETDNSTLKTALDNYFASNEIKTTKDKTLRNTDIADLVKADDDVIAAKSGYRIEGDGTALGSDGSGKLTITHGSTTYTYAFTANVTVSDKTEAEANKAALATVNATAYPEYKTDGTVKYDTTPAATHNETLLKNKLLSDLKDAGYNTNGQSLAGTASKNEAAEKTTNGEYKTVIRPNSDVVDVALTYSSDQKLLDTEKALEKFLAKGSSKSTNSDTYTSHSKTTTAVTLDDAATPHDVYDFADTSALSQKVQAKTAIKATSASDAADIVKAAIDEQLTKAGIADNGVSVSVKAVNKATANGTKYDVDDTYVAATPADRGNVTLLVTASIKNDFYGWSDGTNKDKTKTVSYSYLMTIDTNKLKENKVKTISLSDKTVLLSGGYYTASKTSGQNSANEVTYVEITPVIDPADTNSTVTYKVLDADNSVVTDTVKVGTDVYKKDSDTAVKVGTNALGLKITKAGTYTIKATVDDAEATMTLTVKKNFDDVPATAYYNKAVAWAYQNGITAGTTENTFGSNVDVTRAQFVTWLYKYAVSKDASAAIADSDVKSVFSDVSTGAFYAKAVQWAVANGVTAGTTATTFSPDQNITRAQALTMLWRAMGSPTVGEGKEYEQTLKFTDLPTNEIFRTAIVWAIHEGVTAGTTPTTCSPDNICPRSQAITFIYGANKKYFS